jgi:hypothetical protein
MEGRAELASCKTIVRCVIKKSASVALTMIGALPQYGSHGEERAARDFFAWPMMSEQIELHSSALI